MARIARAVWALSTRRPAAGMSVFTRLSGSSSPSRVPPSVIAIGSSTGGPQALFEVLGHLKGIKSPPQHAVAILIPGVVAHMEDERASVVWQQPGKRHSRRADQERNDSPGVSDPY